MPRPMLRDLEYLTTPELAEYLGVAVITIRQWLRKGRIAPPAGPPLGRHWRWTIEQAHELKGRIKR